MNYCDQHTTPLVIASAVIMLPGVKVTQLKASIVQLKDIAGK